MTHRAPLPVTTLALLVVSLSGGLLWTATAPADTAPIAGSAVVEVHAVPDTLPVLDVAVVRG